MVTLPGRLGSLKACDVMTRDVIVLTDSNAIGDAVQMLKGQRITGAPVVDSAGKLVGILSISDLVQAAGSVSEEQDLPPTPLAHGEDATTWDLFEKADVLGPEVSVEEVRERMSRKVASVTDQAPLVEVARVMCSGHWHRVPVVDDSGSLCGIISTMDVLAAVVNTADEPG